jgi:DHA1 family bicyclomycin/chloramphenicol resistance-like MFS transporter
MAIAAAINVGYNWFFAATVPWAVLPLFLFSFSLALAMPPLTLAGMNLFPQHSGLAASMQSFLQMMLFALVSGLVAPLLFGSALHLAFGLVACLLVSYATYRGATHGQGAGVTS